MKKLDLQSYDNGCSWRIIREWEFKRVGNSICMAGVYTSKKNYYLYAYLLDGEIAYDNPRQVHIPLYARKIVAEMLTQDNLT